MRTILFIVFSAFASLQAGITDSAGKHAVIIAIGNYPESGGWGSISSVNDVGYVKNALLRQGFADNHIAVYRDSQATRSGLETALKDLISRVKPNDVVVIHVSSHGEQIEDNNNDEPDGLDEAIVCFDAVSPQKSKNFSTDTFGYLRDDIFGSYVHKLRQKLGPGGDLLVLMDACHSGTGTRGGTMKSRGGEKPLVSSSFNPEKFKNPREEVFDESENSGGLLSTYTVISAARSDQLAREVLNDDKVSMGSLSYAECKALEQLGNEVSYRTLFARIQSVFNSKVPGQYAVMEGNGADRLLFGGNYVNQKNYFSVHKIRNEHTLELEGGSFAGLTKGARVVLCPAGTVTPEKNNILDTCDVFSGDAYKCLVNTHVAFTDQNAAVWAFVVDPVYQLDSIVLELPKNQKNRTGYSAAEIQSIQSQMADQPLIRFNGPPQLTLSKGPVYDSLIVSDNGYPFATIKRDQNYSDELKKKVRQFAQYRFLQSLNLTDSTVLADVELVPIENDLPDTSAIGKYIVNGVLKFADGDAFTIQVHNKSKMPLYINILDLQPDGWINPIFPNKEMEVYAGDLIIQPGKTRLFSEFSIGIGPPYGMEVYKIFLSQKKIDLENLVVMRGKGEARGNFGVLENLVETSLDVTARGSNVSVRTANANGSVQDLMFEIVPAVD